MIMIYLILAGVTTLFLGFALAYAYTRFDQGAPAIKLPWLFFPSTVVLWYSSYLLKKVKIAYEEDDPETFVKMLRWTLITSLIFLVMQCAGWIELITTGIPVTYSTLASYIYVISAVHLGHVLLGLPFLIIYYIKSKRRLSGELESMVFFADPDPRRHLKLLSIYWIFLDRLWIGLMIFFWVNWLIPGA